MEDKKIIMRCCICGRVKTDDGWEYQYSEQDREPLSSHGFCTVCYEAEIKKMKMQAVLSGMTLYQA